MENLISEQEQSLVNMLSNDIINPEKLAAFLCFMNESIVAFNKYGTGDSIKYINYLYVSVWPIIEEILNNKHKIEDMLIKQNIMYSPGIVVS
ncbi:MAG: hypothetical protein [Wendovervirus sonii]|uniref:Uncharacterized protein n=1 Tax=phage Lak_Megaphage_Sonny TaxID=3109229 RepID=A0ABZ0Z6F8_9CAUD|nr:MAG: hypothetical protein [phage Lak_Megaphage_Sonny]